MLTILIVDDDEEVRRKAMRSLAGEDIKLASASNGRIGLEQAALLLPDIVICDVDMPEVNGFDLLASLKADERLASAQIMMLTAQRSRHSMRLGMSLGADDYLTKPFTDEELIEAVDGLIKRRGRIDLIKETALRSHEDSLRRRFAQGIGGEESAGMPLEPDTQPDHVLVDAAVLFADIRGFTSIAEKLSSQDVAKLLTEYFERACEPILVYGGQYLKLMGDGLMAVFCADAATSLNPSRRALLAATEMAAINCGVAAWMTTTFPDALLPAFRVGFGVHCGEVAVSQMGAGKHKAATPIGDTVNIASRLESASKKLGWDIVASGAAVKAAGAGVHAGATATITVRGREAPIEVIEVLALADGEAETAASGFEKTLPAHRALARHLPHTLRLNETAALRLRMNAREHASLAARAVKDALGDKLSALRRGDFGEADSGKFRLEGFRVLRRLASGGMSTIYLARREEDGELVVLKVVPLDGGAGDLAARFMREFSLLSMISHPHIVRIFNQGFGEDAAYIAMEYFENGDLRSRMVAPLTPKAAIAVLRQVADALGEVHRLGIVHRDLKPENLMVRANGDVVLADFGIAKAVASRDAREPSLTLSGELLGSPSYMSPEQIAGGPLTVQSDQYSLGVLLFELLTGKRPYRADTLMELLSLHAKAPPPALPAGLEALNPILDRLMAKQPSARYPSVGELGVELRRVANLF